jgi:hypothetical protein
MVDETEDEFLRLDTKIKYYQKAKSGFGTKKNLYFLKNTGMRSRKSY